MTVSSAIVLFLSMIVLAAIPGPGALSVTARASIGGFSQGLSATAGIVTGDFVFISIALAGLTTLSNALGELFVLIKYVGAAYLIWLGISLMTTRSNTEFGQQASRSNHLTSFAIGLITTLGNPKAMLFYFSLFPTLMNLSRISLFSAVSVYFIATVSVGGVMLVYAYLTTKLVNFYSNSANNRTLNGIAGSTLIGSGVFVALRS